MSTYAEQPFTEFEERYFLAEILKKSALPPATLLAIIRDARIDPAWNDIALPNGRSVSSCQQAFQSLYSRTSMHPPQPLQLAPPEPPRGHKRPYSSLGDANSNMPQLQPRPPSFASVNGQGVPIGPGPPPPPLVMSPVEPQRKKRGRPTKAEYERRQAEAHERGEIWPKPRKAKPKPTADSPEGKKDAAGSSSGPPSTASPPKPESSGSGSAPTAVMQSWSAAPQPPPQQQQQQPQQPPPPSSSQPARSPKGQGFGLPGMERRAPDQQPPVTPTPRTEGPGRELLMEPPLQHHPHGPPGHPIQQGGPQPHYGQPLQSQGKGSPMDTSPPRGYQQRDTPTEQRHQH